MLQASPVLNIPLISSQSLREVLSLHNPVLSLKQQPISQKVVASQFVGAMLNSGLH